MIKSKIPKTLFVTIKIFDILGREIQTLISEEKSPGKYSVVFDASRFSSGVYFYRLTSGGFTEIKKMILLK
ncbi:MAG TPA: T9SS type A sorting domain-containing protein [Ignavibacteriaceae bacterium]|nr:T9SS type A sorting domain-containing protein [Ignavibacteriaceae bacterium]